MKTCRDCKLSKALSEFGRKSDAADGYIGACKFCMRQALYAWRKNNPEKWQKQYKRNNRNRYYKNPQAYMSKQMQLRVISPELYKGFKKKASAKCDRANQARRNAIQNARRAKSLLATIKLSQKHLQEIQYIYNTCPKGYHVDHIIPLQGKDVCGLHVPWNLQHLPAIDNLRKGNKLERRIVKSQT